MPARIPDADVAFAEALIGADLLPLPELLAAVAVWGRRGVELPLADSMVADSILSAEVAASLKLTAKRPEAQGLRGPRYQIGDVLGRGANGVVHQAGDRRLGRLVALKVLAKDDYSDRDLLRFSHEAQVTGQLAHPSIVPVHDLGVLPDGRPYYTMKRIGGESLAAVLAALRDGEQTARDRWTLPRFLITMLRITQALAFAHDRGVVHRDVKPANVMLGDYGEVLLLDWGVARVLPGGKRGSIEVVDAGPQVATWRTVSGRDPTLDGTIAGTPAYMAPEQARGDLAAIGPASDVYSIGVMIYEFLAGSRPIRGRTVEEILRRVIEDPIPPIRERNPAADVADELDALVMRCLDKEPTARFADGSALAHALEAILEGSRRRAQAEDLARKGLARASAYARAAEATADAERTFAELRSQTPLWASTGDRALVWDQEARYRDLRKLRDDSYDEAVSLLLSALERDRTLSEARSGLASLYVRRLDEAEARGDLAAARFFRSQVIRHDDGALTHLLIGASSLQFDAGAEFELTLRPWEDGGPRLVLGDGEALGTTRSLDLPLRAGRYLLSARADGFAPVDVPLYADRPASHPVFVPAIRDLPDGFIVIVAGRYLRGGDPGAADGGRREAVDVDGFAIAKHPVSQREFARFLRDGGADSGFAVWGGPDDLSPEDRAFLPALGVTFEAATAYCAWLGKRLSRAVRLPTADEWEKAARGVDGRIFPWGDRWEPAFCACGESSPGDPRPEPIGGRRDDCSPYGVMDLAGGVHEWVTDPVPHRPERGFLRGGAWNAPAQASRLAGRLSLPRTTRSGAVGFRVAIDLSIPRSDRAADYSDLSHDRML